MKIVTTFEGNQKHFHWYWLPLMYKHQEVTFYVQAPHKFIYPKDVKNLKINEVPKGDGPTLNCPMNLLPTYRAMEQFAKKKKDWTGTPEDLGERFYEV